MYTVQVGGCAVLVLYIHIFVAQRNSSLFVWNKNGCPSRNILIEELRTTTTTVTFVPSRDGRWLDSHHWFDESWLLLIFFFFFFFFLPILTARIQIAILLDFTTCNAVLFHDCLQYGLAPPPAIWSCSNPFGYGGSAQWDLVCIGYGDSAPMRPGLRCCPIRPDWRLVVGLEALLNEGLSFLHSGKSLTLSPSIPLPLSYIHTPNWFMYILKQLSYGYKYLEYVCTSLLYWHTYAICTDIGSEAQHQLRHKGRLKKQ